MLIKRKNRTQPPETQEQRLQDALTPVVVFSFNGAKEFFRVRDISNNTAQIIACAGDNISLIQTFADKIASGKQATLAEMGAYVERQHNIARACMIEPSFQKVLDIAQTGLDLKSVDADLRRVQELAHQLREDRTMYKKLQDDYAKTELLNHLLLPSDFLGELTAFALGLANSDIKLLTHNMLYNAAITARNNNNAPHENLTGLFTEFNKYDIDRRAWNIYVSEQEKSKQKRAS